MVPRAFPVVLGQLEDHRVGNRDAAPGLPVSDRPEHKVPALQRCPPGRCRQVGHVGQVDVLHLILDAARPAEKIEVLERRGAQLALAVPALTNPSKPTPAGATSLRPRPKAPDKPQNRQRQENTSSKPRQREQVTQNQPVDRG